MSSLQLPSKPTPESHEALMDAVRKHTRMLVGIDKPRTPEQEQYRHGQSAPYSGASSSYTSNNNNNNSNENNNHHQSDDDYNQHDDSDSSDDFAHGITSWQSDRNNRQDSRSRTRSDSDGHSHNDDRTNHITATTSSTNANNRQQQKKKRPRRKRRDLNKPVDLSTLSHRDLQIYNRNRVDKEVDVIIRGKSFHAVRNDHNNKFPSAAEACREEFSTLLQLRNHILKCSKCFETGEKPLPKKPGAGEEDEDEEVGEEEERGNRNLNKGAGPDLSRMSSRELQMYNRDKVDKEVDVTIRGKSFHLVRNENNNKFPAPAEECTEEFPTLSRLRTHVLKCEDCLEAGEDSAFSPRKQTIKTRLKRKPSEDRESDVETRDKVEWWKPRPNNVVDVSRMSQREIQIHNRDKVDKEVDMVIKGRSFHAVRNDVNNEFPAPAEECAEEFSTLSRLRNHVSKCDECFATGLDLETTRPRMMEEEEGERGKDREKEEKAAIDDWEREQEESSDDWQIQEEVGDGGDFDRQREDHDHRSRSGGEIHGITSDSGSTRSPGKRRQAKADNGDQSDTTDNGKARRKRINFKGPVDLGAMTHRDRQIYLRDKVEKEVDVVIRGRYFHGTRNDNDKLPAPSELCSEEFATLTQFRNHIMKCEKCFDENEEPSSMSAPEEYNYGFEEEPTGSKGYYNLMEVNNQRRQPPQKARTATTTSKQKISDRHAREAQIRQSVRDLSISDPVYPQENDDNTSEDEDDGNESSAAALDRGVPLQVLRQEATDRLADVWNEIIERYEKNYASDQDDEVDLRTGMIVVDRGVIRGQGEKLFGTVTRLGKALPAKPYEEVVHRINEQNRRKRKKWKKYDGLHGAVEMPKKFVTGRPMQQESEDENAPAAVGVTSYSLRREQEVGDEESEVLEDGDEDEEERDRDESPDDDDGGDTVYDDDKADESENDEDSNDNDQSFLEVSMGDLASKEQERQNVIRSQQAEEFGDVWVKAEPMEDLTSSVILQNKASDSEDAYTSSGSSDNEEFQIYHNPIDDDQELDAGRRTQVHTSIRGQDQGNESDELSEIDFDNLLSTPRPAQNSKTPNFVRSQPTNVRTAMSSSHSSESVATASSQPVKKLATIQWPPPGRQADILPLLTTKRTPVQAKAASTPTKSRLQYDLPAPSPSIAVKLEEEEPERPIFRRPSLSPPRLLRLPGKFKYPSDTKIASVKNVDRYDVNSDYGSTAAMDISPGARLDFSDRQRLYSESPPLSSSPVHRLFATNNATGRAIASSSSFPLSSGAKRKNQSEDEEESNFWHNTPVHRSQQHTFQQARHNSPQPSAQPVRQTTGAIQPKDLEDVLTSPAKRTKFSNVDRDVSMKRPLQVQHTSSNNIRKCDGDSNTNIAIPQTKIAFAGSQKQPLASLPPQSPWASKATPASEVTTRPATVSFPVLPRGLAPAPPPPRVQPPKPSTTDPRISSTTPIKNFAGSMRQTTATTTRTPTKMTSASSPRILAASLSSQGTPVRCAGPGICKKLFCFQCTVE